MRATLVVGYGVNFVHDHSFYIAQDLPAALGGEQDVERLGGGDQDVRRAFEHGPALLHEGVAGADGGTDLRHEQPALAGELKNFRQRAFEIFLDVVTKGFERGDIEDFGTILQVSIESLTNQAVNAGKKSSES